MQYEVVHDKQLLRQLRKEGLVKFTDQTLKRIKSLYSKDSFTCFYIDEAPIIFEWQNRTFGQKFISGCFILI
jgi:hypothetical protein